MTQYKLQSVQVIFEDRPLLRIMEQSGLKLEYELNTAQLRLLAMQAVKEALKT